MWPIVELFANMDLAQLSSIVPDPMLEAIGVRPWNNASENLGELASGSYMRLFCVNFDSSKTSFAELYRSVAHLITRAIIQQLEDEGLQRPGYNPFLLSSVNLLISVPPKASAILLHLRSYWHRRLQYQRGLSRPGRSRGRASFR